MQNLPRLAQLMKSRNTVESNNAFRGAEKVADPLWMRVFTFYVDMGAPDLSHSFRGQADD